MKRTLVEPENEKISMLRQCELLGLNRSTIYYRERPENAEDVELMRLIDAQYTETPFYGYRRMTIYLQNLGHKINHKRVVRLMKKLGLTAICPKPNLSKPITSETSVSVERNEDRVFKQGLGNGHHLYQIERRIHLFVGNYGLAFKIFHRI